MPKLPEPPRCFETNSIGIRCGHAAVVGGKWCGFHNPWRKRCYALKDDGTRCVRGPMVGMKFCAAHVGYKGTRAEDEILPPPPTEESILAEELAESPFLDVQITDPQEFAQAVLQSRDFRQYILIGLQTQELPSSVILRLMDYAWGKPVERVEHTGKDGQPIVTEVRRVVIRVNATPVEDVSEEVDHPLITH